MNHVLLHRRFRSSAGPLAVVLTVGLVATAAVAITQLGGSPSQRAAAADPLPTPVELANPSFEMLDDHGFPEGWSLDPAPRAQTAASSTAHQVDGGRSLRIQDPADQSIAVRSAAVPAQPGAAYLVQGSVFTESGAPAWVYLEFFDTAGNRLTEKHVMPSPAAEWTGFDVSGTAPAAAATLDVLIYGGASTAGVSYVDALSVSTDAVPPPPYDPAIGQDKQLFVDDYRIEQTERISTVVHQARKDGRVMVADQPWESNNVYLYGSVIRNQQSGEYQMWYQAYDRSTEQYFVCYATSKDGLHWTKPTLGVHDYQGSSANNIVGTMHSPTVLRDDRDADPTRRYKMFGVIYGSGYGVWFSPDGIRWTPSALNPVLPDADVSNVTYDPRTEQFMVTSKHPDPSGRAVFLSTSDDFENWSDPQLVLRADERDQGLAAANGVLNSQVYGMPIAPYEGVYVGFPWIFQYGGSGAPGTAGEGAIDTQIAFSRDASRWTRDDRTVVIPRGVEGSFDSGMTFSAGNLVVDGGRVLLYYGGWDGTHGSATRGAGIGLASWRLDGFASLSNGGDIPGTVTTKPLVFDGNQLRVNAEMARSGALQVEVLDESGTPLPGFDLEHARPVRSGTDTIVQWTRHPDLGAHAGQKIRLRFHLSGGDIYAFRFTQR